MKYAAEMFGTFVLVLAGLGAAVLGGGQFGIVGIALAFGIALMTMAYTLGPISGCHINPAVSLGMFLTKRMSLTDMFGYWIAQIIGAILAAAVVLVIANGGPDGYNASVSGFAANGYADHSPGHYSLIAALVAEAFLTMILVLTVLSTTDSRVPAGIAPIPIGLALTAIHFAGVPVTNGSFNPARSIGPAVFVGGWAMVQIWLFILAPMIGAVLASRVYLGLKPSGK
jgi:aquaporin Z